MVPLVNNGKCVCLFPVKSLTLILLTPSASAFHGLYSNPTQRIRDAGMGSIREQGFPAAGLP